MATTDAGALAARRVILCTGGKSLPKSGSDGLGFELARSLGHSVTEPLVPALDQQRVSPFVSVIVTVVLLNEAWMCASP